MDNKDEMIEEISDNLEMKEDTSDNINNTVQNNSNNQNVAQQVNQNVSNEQINGQVGVQEANVQDNMQQVEQPQAAEDYIPKKSKVLPLIILFTLLIIDIALIVIYIIGPSKVLSFIK